MNLRIPGPTPLPPEVTAALSRPMINHRGPQFVELQGRVLAGLKEILETNNDIIIYPSSGTGGMEAALANVLSPGDRVLACTAGAFGDRFAEMAKRFGAQVNKLCFPMGQAIDPEKVAEELRNAPDTRTVLLTHSETSSGVLHPIEALAKTIRANSGALILVDAVSSAGATRVQTDAWGLDVVITGSQKALMSPPGASVVAIGERAWRAYETARSPRYFWDWREWTKMMAVGQTPVTPPLPIYFAMDVALDLIKAEGLNAVYARHERLAELTRNETVAMGLTLFADPRYASPTVTALRPPAGIKSGDLIARCRDELGVEFAGGQGEAKGKVLRIGHLGYVHEADIREALGALKQALAASPVVHATSVAE